MPGLLTILGRIIAGKPVYEPGDITPGAPPQAPPDASIHKRETSTFPVVRVHRINTNYNGNNMDVSAIICNESAIPIQLDRFNVLGHDIRLPDDLRPNQAREYPIYRGPMLKARGDGQAKLQYRTAEGHDYFEAAHDVYYEYHREQNAYSISEMRLHPPIRDVYG